MWVFLEPESFCRLEGAGDPGAEQLTCEGALWQWQGALLAHTGGPSMRPVSAPTGQAGRLRACTLHRLVLKGRYLLVGQDTWFQAHPELWVVFQLCGGRGPQCWIGRLLGLGSQPDLMCPGHCSGQQRAQEIDPRRPPVPGWDKPVANRTYPPRWDTPESCLSVLNQGSWSGSWAASCLCVT